MKKPSLTLRKNEVKTILAQLEFLIVSLERIGSRTQSRAWLRDELYAFVIHGDVFKRLAAIRRIILKRFDQSASPRAREALEKSLEAVKPWK